MALVLVIDSDSPLGEALQRHFQLQGHQALLAHTGHEACDLAERCSPDIIVMSATLPRGSASTICRQLKAAPGLSRIPVIWYCLHVQISEQPIGTFLSSQRRQTTLADLASSAAAALNRSYPLRTPAPTDHLIGGRLILHAQDLTVEIGARTVNLTRTEFELLRYLMLHIDEACPSRHLLRQVWGYPPGTGSTDVVRTHIRNLRVKIEECPAKPAILRTVRNCGYMLCSDGHGERPEVPARAPHAELPRYLPYSLAVPPAAAP